MKQYPPLKALLVFEVAARHLNFRMAGDELGVSQGAVAQQIRGLEASLGMKLFERLPRGLALTDEGRAYLGPVSRALKMIVEATDALKPRNAVLTISVTPSFATKWLVPKLGDFTKTNPDLDVRVTSDTARANFQSDNVDIAVREGSPPFGPGLIADLLYPQGQSVVCSPDLLAHGPPLVGVEDLDRHVLLHDAHGLWPVFLQEILPGKTIAGSGNLMFSQASLAIDAAIAGQGVALVSHSLVEVDIATGRLVNPFTVNFAGTPGYYVISPRKAPRNKDHVVRMREWLLSCRND